MKDSIQIINLSKQYLIPKGSTSPPYQTLSESIAQTFSGKKVKRNFDELWALQNINLTIKKGEKIGIIGHNGAGKTTLLKILSQITPPTSGRAIINGRVGSLLEVGTGFHPELTGKENIYLNGAILGMSKSEISQKLAQIIDFSEVGNLINSPVKHYSSGLYMRLAFSVAAHLDTEILLVDEVLSVGDLNFQNKCIGKISEISNQGRTVLFVSHNLTTIRQLCEKAILLNKGKIVCQGEVNKVIDQYLKSASESNDTIWQNNDPEEINQDAYIKSISLLDKNKLPKKVFLNTDEILVEFNVVVNIESSDLKVGFDLFYQGSLAFRSQQVDSFSSVKNLNKGTNLLTCIISKNILNKGTYYISPIFALHAIKTLRGPKPPVLEFIVDIDTTISPFHGLINNISQPGPVFPLLKWTNNTGINVSQRHSRSNRESIK